MTKEIIFTLALLSVVMGIGCLLISIQNMRIERLKNENNKRDSN